MNRTTRYYRLNWELGGHAIIRRYGSARILKGTPKFNQRDGIGEIKNTVFGYFIYGSKRGYDDYMSQKHLFFSNVKDIQELTHEQVAKDHFIGML